MPDFVTPDLRDHIPPRDALGWPRNLTHCCVCDQPFPEPVEAWDDYFVEVEDASFACGPCAEREGYPSA